MLILVNVYYNTGVLRTQLHYCLAIVVFAVVAAAEVGIVC